MEKINTFRGQNDFLSNMYPCTIRYKGILFSCAEAAYQYHKLIPCKETLGFWKLDGKEAKQLGRKLKMKPNWDNEKIKVMTEIVTEKFKQNANLMIKLLDTGDTHLEEGNQWGDTYWGTVNGKGENHLGKILMEIREKYKYKYKFYIKELEIKNINAKIEEINLKRIEKDKIPLEYPIYTDMYKNKRKVNYDFPLKINMEGITQELVRTSSQLYMITKDNKNKKLVLLLRPYSVDELIGIHQEIVKLSKKGVQCLAPDGKPCLSKMDKILKWLCQDNIMKISVVYYDNTKIINRKAMKAKIFTLNNIIMTNPLNEEYAIHYYEDYSTLYLESYRSQPYLSLDDMGEEIAPIYSKKYFRKVPNQRWTLLTRCSAWVQTKYTDKGIKVPPLKSYAKFYVNYIGDPAEISNNKEIVKELNPVIINICKLSGINPDDYTREDLVEVLKFMLNNLKNFIDESLSLNQLKELYNIIPDSITLYNTRYVIKDIVKDIIIERFNSGLYPLDEDICCTFNVKTSKADYSNVIDDDYNLYIENIGYEDGYVHSEEEEDE